MPPGLPGSPSEDPQPHVPDDDVIDAEWEPVGPGPRPDPSPDPRPEPAAPPPPRREAAEPEISPGIDQRIRENLRNRSRNQQQADRPSIIPLKQMLEWADNNFPALHISLILFSVGIALFFVLGNLNQLEWAFVGLAMMILSVLLLLDFIVVKSDPKQRGVRKRWETYYGKALRPSIYFQWRWWPFFHKITIVDVGPIRDPAKPKVNPEYVIEEVMCHRNGLNDKKVRDDTGQVNPQKILDGMKNTKFKQGKDEGGFGDFSVDVTLRVAEAFVSGSR